MCRIIRIPVLLLFYYLINSDPLYSHEGSDHFDSEIYGLPAPPSNSELESKHDPINRMKYDLMLSISKVFARHMVPNYTPEPGYISLRKQPLSHPGHGPATPTGINEDKSLTLGIRISRINDDNSSWQFFFDRDYFNSVNSIGIGYLKSAFGKNENFTMNAQLQYIQSQGVLLNTAIGPKYEIWKGFLYIMYNMALGPFSSQNDFIGSHGLTLQYSIDYSIFTFDPGLFADLADQNARYGVTSRITCRL